MVFSSLTFLCLFLPIVFILYTVIPNLKVRNVLLIIASLFFYAYGEPIYVFLMIFSSLLNYLCALWVCKNPKKKSKFALVFAVVVNLGILGVYKYTGFILDTVNSIFNLSIPVPQIALPIGISFFTFQALSYVIDVYLGKVDVQKNFFNILLYVSFFPQLIAGPIVKYHDINEQIDNRKQDLDKIALGLRRFIVGLSKKVFIANTMGQVADSIFATNADSLSILTAWLGAIAYIFQIYYDFCGYSDMAIGLGHMFGFEFKENFNYPYGSKNIQDFWRRWHISLSTWFKEYLYIPLGGNRKGKLRTAINKIIVFFATGLWHGANWTFVIWGLWHGMFLLLEEFIPFLKKLPKAIAHIYTMLVVALGFVVFRADTIGYGLQYIMSMFTVNSNSESLSLAISQLTPWFILILVAAVIGCAPIKPLTQKIQAHSHADGATLSKKWKIIQIALYVLSFVMLLWCIIRLSGTAYNPFIYFRF
ncbi:MAG: MBOAT family protein [Ruminococcus sp.]|nr:MBOAT family protein [Ruminococcus sp.]